AGLFRQVDQHHRGWAGRDHLAHRRLHLSHPAHHQHDRLRQGGQGGGLHALGADRPGRGAARRHAGLCGAARRHTPESAGAAGRRALQRASGAVRTKDAGRKKLLFVIRLSSFVCIDIPQSLPYTPAPSTGSFNMRLSRPRVHGLLCLAFAAIGVGATPDAPAAPEAAPAGGAPTYTVNNTADIVADFPLDDGICTTHYDSGTPNGICTLRAAVMEANHTPGGGATINILAGVYPLSSPPIGVDDETTGDLNLKSSMTIAGAGSNSTLLDGAGQDRVFNVAGSITVAISDLTIRNGYTAEDGAGIRSQGNLSLNGLILSGNFVNAMGGGVHGAAGKLTLDHSLIPGNHANPGYGGGLAASAETHPLNSTISNNTASSNDILTGYGGGLYVDNSAAVDV